MFNLKDILQNFNNFGFYPSTFVDANILNHKLIDFSVLKKDFQKIELNQNLEFINLLFFFERPVTIEDYLIVSRNLQQSFENIRDPAFNFFMIPIPPTQKDFYKFITESFADQNLQIQLTHPKTLENLKSVGNQIKNQLLSFFSGNFNIRGIEFEIPAILGIKRTTKKGNNKGTFEELSLQLDNYVNSLFVHLEAFDFEIKKLEDAHSQKDKLRNEPISENL